MERKRRWRLAPSVIAFHPQSDISSQEDVDDVHLYSENQWRKLGKEMVMASGATREHAEVIADVVVSGSLRGIDSHGVRILPYFTEKREMGEMRVTKETKATAVLDAANVWGPVSAEKAMRIAMDKASDTGLGSCTIANGDWITNLFYYSAMALRRDMIGMVFVRDNTCCSPWGGTVPVTGTDPISIAIPAGKVDPIVLDFATTAVAQGHVRTLLLEGKPIPEGWLIDREGNSVHGNVLSLDNIDEFWERGGSLLPFGTYKGYALNLAIGVLGGALNLTGTGTRGKGQGVTVFAVDVGAFVPVAEFKEEVDRLVREIKSSPVRPGFKEVLLPGEIEYRAMAKRRREGIPIDDKSWAVLVQTCKKIGIDAVALLS
jgi:LDH2 family malate/lactate/ureidoglycolate dehydrogenase